MEDQIRGLLDEVILKTLQNLDQNGNPEETKAELTKLTDLYVQRIKEGELELKERQRIDDTIDKGDMIKCKEDELDLKKKELEIKVAQFNNENALKKMELEIRKAEIENSKLNTIVNTSVTVFATVVPIIASSYWMAKGLQFEESGTFTSRTMQWLSSHLRLFKKG